MIVANAINRAGDRDSRAATHGPVARLLLSSSHLVTQTLPAERDNGRVCVSLVKKKKRRPSKKIRAHRLISTPLTL